MEGNYFLMEDGKSFNQKLEAKYGRELLPHGRQRSFTWKLEAKYGRELFPHGRRQIFYLETRGQIWKEITSSWKTADLLPGNWRSNLAGS